MLHADPFSWRSDAGTRVADRRPVVAATGGRSGFDRVYAHLHREIDETVRNGFGPPRRTAVSMQQEYWPALDRARGEARASQLDSVRAGDAMLEQLVRAGSLDPRQRAFVADVLPHARRAAAMLGASPDLIVAHAALESGWGQHPLRHPDGRSSYNLFGIKATGGWKGGVVDSATTEYVNGAEIKTVERFRAYRGYADAFGDYATLIKGNRRYAGALGHGDDVVKFATGLVRGGYATDPRYASKLSQIVAQMRDVRR